MDTMHEQIVTTTNIIASSSHIPSATHNSMTLVDLGKRLLDASKKGDTTEIRSLMSGGAPFTTDWLGTSPLHFAAMYGHIDTVTILLRAGISRDARTKVDRTPLHVAAQNGHFDIVKILVANNALIDATDMLKMTPLHWAVENGHTNIVNLLLKHSANTSIVDKFDRTPMDIALGNMQMDIVQLLQNASQQARTAGFIQSTTIQDDIVEEEVMTDDAAGGLNQVTQEEITSLSTSEQPDGEDGTVTTSEGNTSVLAALAVLAEATASTNANTNPTVSVRTTSAVNNQNTPFTLTEAGKLALNNYFKEHGMNESEHQVVTLVDEQGNQVLVVQSNQGDDSQTQSEHIELTQNNQLMEDSVE